jgi:predicted alpha-1,6-mannanase (GH76 family)
MKPDARYFDQFLSFYRKQPIFSLLFQQYDDQLWVCLTYLRAAAYAKIHAIKWEKRFLWRAKLFYNLARCGWDNKTCGGGMYWGPNSTYKNAVTTELFITASMQMYEVHRKPRMLQAAIRGWVWFKSSGMINQQGLVNDGLDNCKYCAR